MKPDPTCCATPSSAPREKRTRSPPITCTGRVDIPALILYSLMHTLYQVRVTHGGNSRSPWLRRRPAAQAPHSARTSPLRTVRAVCGAVSVPCAVCLQERCPRALPPCSRPHPPNFRGRGREHSSSKDSKQADGTLHGNSNIKIKPKDPWYHQSPGGRGSQPGTQAQPAAGRAGNHAHDRNRYSQSSRGRGTSQAESQGQARRVAAAPPLSTRTRQRTAQIGLTRKT